MIPFMIDRCDKEKKTETQWVIGSSSDFRKKPVDGCRIWIPFLLRFVKLIESAFFVQWYINLNGLFNAKKSLLKNSSDTIAGWDG